MRSGISVSNLIRHKPAGGAALGYYSGISKFGGVPAQMGCSGSRISWPLSWALPVYVSMGRVVTELSVQRMMALLSNTSLSNSSELNVNGAMAIGRGAVITLG